MSIDIIIPTKNRYSTLIPTVKAILHCLPDRDYCLIIYDNSDCQIPTEFIESMKTNARVRYITDSENIDVVENFNRAINQVISPYAILIGDDDFILPNIFDAIAFMENEGLDCLIQPRPTYYWPGVSFQKQFDYFEPASLLITNNINKQFKKIDAKKELATVLQLGGIYLYNLPNLYHGIIRSELLKNIKKQYGNYVLGPSPDMSLALVLSAHVKSHGFYSVPFSIAGASSNSAAGMGRRNEHSTTLERVPSWLPKDLAEHWDSRLPKLWNGFTVYAQSLYLTGIRIGAPVDLNYDALFKKMLSDNFQDLSYIKSVPGVQLSKKTILSGFLEYALRSALMRMPSFVLSILVKWRPAFRDMAFYRNVQGPDECITLAMQHINDHLSKMIKSR